MKIHALRLKPGQDLRHEIDKFTHDQNIRAGFIITCVGSLTNVTLRMPGATPDKKIYKTWQGHYEIISLVGVISTAGCHLHMSASDTRGQVLGGHLTEENVLYTTAEIIIGEDETAVYARELDPKTGFPELVIKKTPQIH